MSETEPADTDTTAETPDVTNVAPVVAPVSTPIVTEDNTTFTMDIVASVASAYFSRNDVKIADIPEVINTIYTSITGLGKQPEPVVQAETPVPAVPVDESVFPDYIVCLEDGKKLKMLKRHLQTSFQMTPEQYRARWGLSADYPMTAPSYAEVRSGLAKKIGLGTNGGGRKKPAAAPKAAKKASAKAPAKAAAKRSPAKKKAA